MGDNSSGVTTHVPDPLLEMLATAITDAELARARAKAIHEVVCLLTSQPPGHGRVRVIARLEDEPQGENS